MSKGNHLDLMCQVGKYNKSAGHGKNGLGQISILDIGGGLYEIGGFFDVYTELSVDGGQTWIQAYSAQFLTLLPIDVVPVELQSFIVE